MAFIKLIIFLALVVIVTMADDRPYSNRHHHRHEHPSSSEEDSFEDPKYEFKWQVDEDSNEFGHQEQRDGDHTRGSYYVDLPDGRRQTVTYYVDGDSGFVAEVTYSGEAEFDEQDSSEEYEPPRRAFRPPRPSYRN